MKEKGPGRGRELSITRRGFGHVSWGFYPFIRGVGYSQEQRVGIKERGLEEGVKSF